MRGELALGDEPFTPGLLRDAVIEAACEPRPLLEYLTESLQQPVIVDNRPGAGGMIGARIVAGANPDGYTLMSVSAAHVVTPAVRANLGYDPVRDFAGIDVLHVPHRGIPEALTDTIAGRVHFFMAPMASAITLVKDGKLRAIGVSSPQRHRANPEIPTIAGQVAAAVELARRAGIKPE